MRKKVMIQFQVEFEDLSDDERKVLEDTSLFDPEDGEMPTLADYSARELASIFDCIPGEMFQELFGGSDVYAKIRNTSVVKADFS